jgi:hypothetical protein
MRLLALTFFIVRATLGGMGAGLAAGSEWRLFESKTQHFSVRYPPSWNRLATWDGVMDENILDIINFPNSERLQGVVIKKGGAWVIVGAPPEFIPSVEEWIRGDLKRGVLIDQRAVPISAPSPNGCTSLERVVAREKMDDAYAIDTAYYCTVGSRFYRILLTNWEGDPNQAKLQDTALKVALSLRSR